MTKYTAQQVTAHKARLAAERFRRAVAAYRQLTERSVKQ